MAVIIDSILSDKRAASLPELGEGSGILNRLLLSIRGFYIASFTIPGTRGQGDASLAETRCPTAGGF